jgi:hypothetical protein
MMENMHGNAELYMYGNICEVPWKIMKYQNVGKHMGSLWLASMWENDWKYLEQYRRS